MSDDFLSLCCDCGEECDGSVVCACCGGVVCGNCLQLGEQVGPDGDLEVLCPVCADDAQAEGGARGGPVYLAGYARHSLADLERQVERLHAKVIDIRFSPTSARPEWRWARLEERLGERYRWVQELGNRRYVQRHVGEITIQELEGGLQRIELDLLGPVILLCACSDPRECHRTVVGAELTRRGYAVAELEWE